MYTVRCPHLNSAVFNCGQVRSFQMFPLQITVQTLSVRWSSFYVLGSVNQKCNFYGPYIYAPSIMKTERKAYLKNRTNIILRLAWHGEN
jgi:hypothetical protein